MSEAAIMRAIQLRASQLGCRLLRNNTGMYRRGPRVIRYGLCVGSADLIGWCGDGSGRILCVEVKDGTPTTKAQATFLKAVALAHGIAIVAHSVEEFETQYTHFIDGKTGIDKSTNASYTPENATAKTNPQFNPAP